MRPASPGSFREQRGILICIGYPKESNSYVEFETNASES
jgi:hypothetical protein